MSESFSICDGGACGVSQMSFGTVFEPAISQSAQCTTCPDAINFPPIQGYDMAVTTSADATAMASLPSSFKSGEGVIYERGDALAPSASHRSRVDAHQSPKISVTPLGVGKNADIRVQRDGKVSVADGIADGDKPFTEYKVQIEEGTNHKVTEKVISDLADLIQSKCKGCAPSIDSGKDSSGRQLLSEAFKLALRRRLQPNDHNDLDKDKEDDLPDNPDDLPDNSDGRGCRPGPRPGPSPCPRPSPEPGPDQDDDRDLKPERNKIEPAGDHLYRDNAFKALNRLSTAMADMHPQQYARWLGYKFLPSGALNELGSPPWTGDKLQKLLGYLKSHQGEIAGQLNADAQSLERQGDTVSARAIRDFGSSFKSAVNDPQKLETFATALSNFMTKAEDGTANTTDVHAMFNGDSSLESAVRKSEIIEAGKTYATTRDGVPDLTTLTNDQSDKLIAQLQLGPKPILNGS